MSTLEFVKMKTIQIKPKNIRFRTTIIWLHVGYNLKNTIAIFEISTLEFLNFLLFRAKEKILKFGTPYLGVSENIFEKLLAYLKSALLRLSNGKVWCNNKNL